MKKEIETFNEKGEFHGYQEWYELYNTNNPWFRGCFKHGKVIGYSEYNPYQNEIGERGTKVEFFII